MTKAFRNVEVNNPPKMTFAIGLWISLPGRSPRKASGIRANADESAVIRIGFRRSSEPCTMSLLFAQQVVVADEQHAVTGGDTEQGDESDDGRYTDLTRSQQQGEDTSNQSQRQVQQNDPALGYMVELHIKQQEDDHDAHQRREQQRVATGCCGPHVPGCR